MNPKPTEPVIGSKETLRFIWNVAKCFPTGISVMLLAAIYWSINNSVSPYFLKILLDKASVGASNDFWYLATPAAFWIIMNAGLSLTFRMYDYFVSIRMIPAMRKHVANLSMRNLLTQSHSFYQNNFSGSLANKVNHLIGSTPEIIQIIIDKFITISCMVVLAVVMLWNVNSTFGIIMLIWVIFFMISTIIFSRYLTKFSDDLSEKGSMVIGRIVDILSNIMLIKLFSRNDLEKNDLSKATNEPLIAEQNVGWVYFCLWLILGTSFVLVMTINFYYLITGYNAGAITVGDFVLVVTITVSLAERLWELGQSFASFSKYLGRITQALRDILVVPEIQDITNASKLVVSKGEIKFQNVMFNYKGTSVLFEDKSIIIPAGQKVGLVGYSGSGKSTFVNLILRLYDINNGQILIDEQNIQNVTQDSLRENIGMIPQDPTLFHRTLMENIRYGKTDATDEEVMEAAKRAHAHEFILSLPLGYQSLVGERGVKLSGGQRQRIAIARAILKNAPILMLDEATSQLDSVTEVDIQDSLWHLMQDKTTLVIAHRLSTLLHMDRIIVFDRGKIMEDGSHKELLKKGGLYKTLWDTQVGGFLPDKRG